MADQDEVEPTPHGGTRIRAQAPTRRPVVEFVRVDEPPTRDDTADPAAPPGRDSMLARADPDPLRRPPAAPLDGDTPPRRPTRAWVPKAKRLWGDVRDRADGVLDTLGSRLALPEIKMSQGPTWSPRPGTPPPTPPRTDPLPALVPHLGPSPSSKQGRFKVLRFGPASHTEKDPDEPPAPIELPPSQAPGPPPTPPVLHEPHPLVLPPRPSPQHGPSQTAPVPTPPTATQEEQPVTNDDQDTDQGLMTRLQNRFTSEKEPTEEDQQEPQPDQAESEDQDNDGDGLFGRLKNRFQRDEDDEADLQEDPTESPDEDPDPDPDQPDTPDDATEQDPQPDTTEDATEEDPQEDNADAPDPSHEALHQDADRQPPAPPESEERVPATPEPTPTNDQNTPDRDHATRTPPLTDPAPTPPPTRSRVPTTLPSPQAGQADQADPGQDLEARVDEILDRYEEPPTRARIDRRRSGR